LLLSYALSIAVDALLGRWLLLPLYVMGFYGGIVIIDLLIYPFLQRWRQWLHPYGVRAWYVVEIGLIWISSAIVFALLSPWWLTWRWNGPQILQLVGGVLLMVAVGVSTWAAGQMGWARLLLAGALFPPRGGAEEQHVPQVLVVQGPYRYVRNPLYVTDMMIILGAALLTENLALLLLLVIYVVQLTLQLPLEERELRERFGEAYLRYCERVPRLLPRLTPVDPREIL
jgi:protein-S-isoprenylcysteine O-methyltransferase Ste14